MERKGDRKIERKRVVEGERGNERMLSFVIRLFDILLITFPKSHTQNGSVRLSLSLTFDKPNRHSAWRTNMFERMDASKTV